MLDNPELLRRIEPYATDAAFLERFADVRQRNKERLARIPLFQNLSAKQLAAVDALVTTVDVARAPTEPSAQKLQ